MDLKRRMNQIYTELAPDRIPWNLEHPPGQLVDLVESGRIVPCDAADLGCGAGNYAVWLATQGFRVTGMDISPEAIGLASILADRKGIRCRFRAGPRFTWLSSPC